MTTIHELLKIFATHVTSAAFAEMEDHPEYAEKARERADKIMQQIESYYQPRPEGSVTVTQAEYDTLTAIASFTDQWKSYLYEGGVPLPALNELDALLKKWHEMIAGVE